MARQPTAKPDRLCPALGAAKPDGIYLTQPYGDGNIVDYTWREVADQARRFAAYLLSLNYPKGSNIAILGKTVPIGSWRISPSGWLDMSAFLCIPR